MKDPSRILIIRRDNIGDLICTTPIFRALRARYPDGRIDALVNSYNGPVLRNNPDINQYFSYTKAKHREPGESALGVYLRRIGLLVDLRRQGYDTVILANDGDTARALKFARWLAPARVIAFVKPGRNATGIDIPVPPVEQPEHAVEIAYRLLAPIGIAGTPPALRLSPDRVERERARQAWRDDPILDGAAGRLLAIHVSARKVPQRWPAKRFIELMQRLHRQVDARFMLFWSPGDEDNPLHPGDDRKAGEILAATRDIPVLPYPTARLEQLIGGLSVCDAMVCSDGGAMHIGAGLGLPIVCFFGNSDASRWHPWGVPYELLQEPSGDVNDISVDAALDAYHRLAARTGAA